MRGGGDGAEVEVAVQRVGVGWPIGVPGVGEVDLVDVASGDVVFGGADTGGEDFARGLWGELERRRGRCGQGIEDEVVGEVAGFEPGGSIVDVKEGVGVVTEGEVAVITNPTEETG